MATLIENTPPGYINRGDLFSEMNWDAMPQWRWLLYANVMALIPLGIAILLLWIPYQFYIAFGAPLALPEPGFSTLATTLIGIGMVAFSIVAHEALHGLALRLLGYQPHLSFGGGFLLATVRGFITRRHYLIMILTPLTTITLTGAFLLLWLPVSLGQWLIAALLLNAAASIGDLAVASRVLRLPPDALFADQDGIMVFIPEVHSKS